MDKVIKELNSVIGKKLKAKRKAKGYSLAYVGDSVGKSKASIKRYEDGVVSIDDKTLKAICDVLEIEININWVISLA